MLYPCEAHGNSAEADRLCSERLLNCRTPGRPSFLVVISICGTVQINATDCQHSARTVIPQEGARNVVVGWLTLLLRIREVPCSILARPLAILIEMFNVFPQSRHANAGIVP
jgi:hypothetical protein